MPIGTRILSINPATEEVNATFNAAAPGDVEGAVKKARKAFSEWKLTDVSERSKLALKMAKVLVSRKKELAQLAAMEMGKPVKEGEPEIDKCAWLCEEFAANSERWLADEPYETEAERSFVAFEPLGVVAAIMPWNFPYWQVYRCAIPAILAGNVITLKHSSTVPQIALKMEELFTEAGFPEDVFQTVIGGPPVGELLVAMADAVSVTGSVGAGKRIMELAAKTGPKKVLLELGGSDPFIVLEDANLSKTCKTAAEARLINCGQSCIAAKRFIVVSKIADKFLEGFVDSARGMKVGDPLDTKTDIGPMANKEQLYKIESQLEEAVKEGAKVLTGGRRFGTRGYFFEPTILTNVGKGMRVLYEEVFGPVAPVIVVRDEEEAVKVANDIDLGLGGSVWTSDLKRGERIARRLETGLAFVNMNVRSDPRMPFGGVKKSGVGRELGRYGLLEFTNIKSVKVFPAK